MSNPAPGFIRTPHYPYAIEPAKGRFEIYFMDQQIAATERALHLYENGSKTLYVPAADFRPKILYPAQRLTHCPFKGDAAYWHIVTPEGRADHAVWGYDDPFDESAQIKHHRAFYPAHIEVRHMS